MPLPPGEHPACLAGREKETKKEKKKERMSKKSSDATGAISLLSLAHDSRLCHQPCARCVPQCPTEAARAFGSLGETLLGWQR